jgi:hypothetical protein
MNLGIYDWPTPTIEKSALIEKLEELCRQNPELKHIYENVPMLPISDSALNPNTDDHFQSATRKTHHNRPIFPTNNKNQQPTTNGNYIDANESNLIQNIILAKEGELTVRKGIFLVNEKKKVI